MLMKSNKYVSLWTMLAITMALTLSCTEKKEESTNDLQRVEEAESDIDPPAQVIADDRECSQIKKLDEYDAQNRPIIYNHSLALCAVGEVDTIIGGFSIKHALFESYDKEDLIGPTVFSQLGRKFEYDEYTNYCYGTVVTIILGFDGKPESMNDTLYINRSMLLDSLDMTIPENEKNNFYIYGIKLDSIKSDSIFYSIDFGEMDSSNIHPVKLKLKKTDAGMSMNIERIYLNDDWDD